MNYERTVFYNEKIQYYNELITRLKKNLNFLSFSRFISFILGFVCLIILYKINIFLAVISCLFFLSLFIILVIRYIKKNELKNIYQILLEINTNEINSLNYNYSVFDNGAEFIDNHHFFSYDLDVFGENSLFQYLNRTGTYAGKNKLAEWLNKPSSDISIILEKQKAVKELSEKPEWRQNFQAYGKRYIESVNNEDIILNWLNDNIYFSTKKPYKILRFILPFASTVLFILTLAGISSIQSFLLIFIFNIFFSNLEIKKINKENERLEKRLEVFKKFSYLLKFIEEEHYQSDLLKQLKLQLWHDNSNANKTILKLFQLLNLLEGKNNVLANVFLNGFFSWNIHCLFAIEKWKIKNKKYIPLWFDTIKQIDALCSLANYAYNNPNYVFPNINNSKIISAKKIGHPLIHSDKRIYNDFEITEAGHFVIITGPNMAGKSTFLRTIGVNMLLAKIGAPVCAEHMNFKPLQLFTSMRTSDSLSNNESYFLAELNRFKLLFELLIKDKNYFVILDEILKGTNTQDKQDGSKIILTKLIKNEIPGIIATHDLTLSNLKETYPLNIFDKSFEITIEKDSITYSYILQNGISKKMNAMILMKQMGII
ncbi:MAG: hypothetical protein JXB17_13110 [Bacteroidales bacterium]|nr:hypothetical protein [Bacteroidales bacterium]